MAFQQECDEGAVHIFSSLYPQVDSRQNVGITGDSYLIFSSSKYYGKLDVTTVTLDLYFFCSRDSCDESEVTYDIWTCNRPKCQTIEVIVTFDGDHNSNNNNINFDEGPNVMPTLCGELIVKNWIVI